MELANGYTHVHVYINRRDFVGHVRKKEVSRYNNWTAYRGKKCMQSG